MNDLLSPPIWTRRRTVSQNDPVYRILWMNKSCCCCHCTAMSSKGLSDVWYYLQFWTEDNGTRIAVFGDWRHKIHLNINNLIRYSQLVQRWRRDALFCLSHGMCTFAVSSLSDTKCLFTAKYKRDQVNKNDWILSAFSRLVIEWCIIAYTKLNLERTECTAFLICKWYIIMCYYNYTLSEKIAIAERE